MKAIPEGSEQDVQKDRMEETLTNRSKIIEEDIQEAEELRDKACLLYTSDAADE